ncbi:unnamed protein product, partial [Mesorhabditis spiculigera]
METINKALHQPMPFTTGGQTISDRLTAAKHSLAGSQLGKTICKATTEELMAPKKKHLDYLLHCTNEPNVSIPSMANLLIERTQAQNWTVVYKALITIHNIMCYGNERFSQYLASCNTTFNLGSFTDRTPFQGQDMTHHVRRYGNYIGEKIATYRSCAFDFCKVKRGREDGLLRCMHTDKLLATLPTLQKQIDALLEFNVSAGELSNGVINCSFILLFRDLIRLFACYNDGIINLLEKYFDMNKKQCRQALDTYKGFLTRLDKVSEFLRVAESVGIDKGEIPDLTRAPASLMQALESHLHHLEGGRGPPPSSQPPPQVQQFASGAYGAPAQANMSDADRQKALELENERFKQFQQRQGGAPQSNPFAAAAPQGQPTKQDDLVNFFDAPVQANPALDPSNPFANFGAPAAAPMQQQPGVYPTVRPSQPTNGMHNMMPGPAALNFYPAFPNTTTYQPARSTTITTASNFPSGLRAADPATFNPFATSAAASGGDQWPGADFAQQQWAPPPAKDMSMTAAQQAVQAALSSNANPFGAAAPQGAAPPNFPPVPPAQSDAPAQPPRPPSNQSSVDSAPVTVPGANLGIYQDTPFSGMDGSYNAPHMLEAMQQHQQDVDQAINSIASMNIGGVQTENKPVPWQGQPGPGRPAAPGYGQPQMGAFGQAPPMAPYGAGYQGYGHPQMWQMQQPGMYGMGQQPQYGMMQPQNFANFPPAQNNGQMPPSTSTGAQPTNTNPFGNPF